MSVHDIPRNSFEGMDKSTPPSSLPPVYSVSGEVEILAGSPSYVTIQDVQEQSKFNLNFLFSLNTYSTMIFEVFIHTPPVWFCF